MHTTTFPHSNLKSLIDFAIYYRIMHFFVHKNAVKLRMNFIRKLYSFSALCSLTHQNTLRTKCVSNRIMYMPLHNFFN